MQNNRDKLYHGFCVCPFLNILLTRDGLIHENDVLRLSEPGKYLKNAFAYDLVPTAELHCDSEADSIVDHDPAQ